MHKIRLTVVDAYPVVCLGIKHMLGHPKGKSIELANVYDNGSQVIDNLKNLDSNVFVIGMCLPDMQGYELAKQILESNPDVKIGIYTHKIDKDCILNAIKCGALGYISKTASVMEFLDFIFSISKGEMYYRGKIADVLYKKKYVDKKYKDLNVTKRESEILQLVLSGLKNREIAGKLSIAERTVEFHKHNLYQKFGVYNPIQLSRAVQQLDIRFS